MAKAREVKLNKTRIYTKLLCLFVFLFALFGVVATVQAANLYFSPSSGSYEIGKTFSVSIYVSSAKQAMNAASSVISLPQDKLEVVSLSKSGSIFSLWVQEPSFSNSAGTVNFEGIVLNPGFTGSSGKIITVNFKVKAAGTATLGFTSSSVLANDGKGTNILASLGNAQFSLGGAGPTVPEVTTPSVVSGAPSAPQISSPTRPDPEKWYSNNDPEFSWKLPSDVTGVSFLLDEKATANPSSVSDSLIETTKFEDVKDGIWYFHIKFKNKQGWGQITHRKVLIDTEKPQLFETTIDNGGDPTNPTPILHFKAIDYFSGIEYYEAKIGEKQDVIPVKIARTAVSNPYEMPLQSPGKHTVIVKAVDAANNETLSALDVIIEPLETPVITEIPKRTETGDSLIIKGTSLYPEGTITVFVKKEGEEPIARDIKTDSQGNWTFIYDKSLDKGIYQVWLEITDRRGARSLPTEKITIAVARSAIFRVGSWAVNFLAVVIPLVALIIALLFILWYGWHKFSILRKKLKKEVREAESALHKAFDLLKEDIHKQVKILEKTKTKRELTEEEEKIIQHLKKDLDDAEKFVRKEIEDIKKEVK